MTEAEYANRLAEIDRLLNDPEVTMDADKVWSLLADIADHATARKQPRADTDAPGQQGRSGDPSSGQ